MEQQKLAQKVQQRLTLEQTQENPSLPERIADGVSTFGGSWKFITLFITFIALWIALNLVPHPADQYPFILLNLVISILSVLQAPFILMSQNRMADIDRKRAEIDHATNLKAELQIQELHKRIDTIRDDIVP